MWTLLLAVSPLQVAAGTQFFAPLAPRADLQARPVVAYRPSPSAVVLQPVMQPSAARDDGITGLFVVAAFGVAVGAAARAHVRMSAAEPTGRAVSRREALAGAAGLAGALMGPGVQSASAGYVTSLGIETTAPKDAELDDDLLKTKKVQDAINGVKKYRSAAQELNKIFSKDKDMKLIPVIRKAFDFSNVRDDINVATSVFDDTTQLTIDRISRNILYDLTELENASRFKKGESEVRTPKKIENVEKWFGKLDTDFGSFLAYFPAKLPAPPPPPPPPPPPAPPAEPAAAPAEAS